MTTESHVLRLRFRVHPQRHGIGGGDLEIVTERGIGMLVEECGQPPAWGKDEAVAFGDIVTEAFGKGPLLPMRFGTTMPTRAAVRDVLTTSGPGWRRRLEALADHVEVVVHVPVPAESGSQSPPAESGRAYLLSRASALRGRETLIRDIRDVVSPAVTEVRPLPSSDGVRVACLVPAGAVDALHARLRAWATRASMHVKATGPWPPFSFVDREDTLS